MANCLSENATVQLIHSNGGLTRLMEFLVTPNKPEIQSAAVKCISRMAQSCKHTTTTNKIIFSFNKNRLEFLMHSLRLCFSLIMLMFIHIFMRGCVAVSHTLLHEQDVEKILVKFLSVADVSLNTSTCLAVAAMSVHPLSKGTFRELGTYAVI